MSKINTIIKTLASRQRVLAFIGLVFLIIVSHSNPLSAQSVLQGYSSEEKLQRGMLVSVKEGDETRVVALTDKTVEKLKGVVVEQNDSPVTISSEDEKIFVADTGTFEVLVTNENGPIKQGDFLSVSSLAGIAMKVTDTQPFIIGRAAADFNGTSDSIGTSEGKNGKSVQFGRIKVDISMSRNPLQKNREKDRIPDALQRISDLVADKPVSSVRIYIGLLIFLVTSAVSGVMLYSGVRSGIISIGRNPLSKASIYRGLAQVVLMSLIVFLTGIFGVYLLLKL